MYTGAMGQESFNRSTPLSLFIEAKRIYQNMVGDYKRLRKRKVSRLSLIVPIANELKNQTPKSIGKKTSHEKPCYPSSNDTAYNIDFPSNSYLPPHFTKDISFQYLAQANLRKIKSLLEKLQRTSSTI
jgi:hypothetical protein